MENSGENKPATGLARITQDSHDKYTVKYDDSKVVVFHTYQRGIMDADMEYRSEATMAELKQLFYAATDAKDTSDAKATNDALEKYLNEIINTMEILDIE